MLVDIFFGSISIFINQIKVYSDFDLKRIQPQKHEKDLISPKNTSMDPKLPNHLILAEFFCAIRLTNWS